MNREIDPRLPCRYSTDLIGAARDKIKLPPKLLTDLVWQQKDLITSSSFFHFGKSSCASGSGLSWAFRIHTHKRISVLEIILHEQSPCGASGTADLSGQQCRL
jgi:hypothetical protein